jgi:hypothetical protein
VDVLKAHLLSTCGSVTATLFPVCSSQGLRIRTMAASPGRNLAQKVLDILAVECFQSLCITEID